MGFDSYCCISDYFIVKMSFLKGLLGFFGRTFVGIGLTLFIFSFFLGYALDDIGVFEESLKESIILNLESMEGYDELVEFCEDNPSDENCNIINNPEQSIEDNESFDQVIGDISVYEPHLLLLRWISIVLFLLGFCLIYLTKKSFVMAMYKVSFSSTITAALAIFYYRYLPALFDKILTGNFLGSFIEGFPVEIVDVVSNIINTWLSLPLYKTYNIAILITAIFLVLTVAFYFIKKKGLYNNSKNKKI